MVTRGVKNGYKCTSSPPCLEMLIIVMSHPVPGSHGILVAVYCSFFIAKMAMFLSLVLFALTETFANEVYANVWAVKMSGGQREVENFFLPYDIHMRTPSSYTFPLTSETEVSFSEVFLECF